MSVLWGCLIAAVGLFCSFPGQREASSSSSDCSSSARERSGEERVHSFHQVSGIMRVSVGVLAALGIIA